MCLTEVWRRSTAQTRPFETDIRIAGIVNPRNPQRAQVGPQVVPILPKERPQDATLRALNKSRHAGKTVDATTSCRAHCDCFNLIVGMMAGKQVEDTMTPTPIF
jgi:hypothetical protein